MVFILRRQKRICEIIFMEIAFLSFKKVYFFSLFNLCNRLYWLFLQEDIALQRNGQLISDFFPSLSNLEAFEANVTNRKSYVSIVKNVTRELMKIEKNMTFIAEVICNFFCMLNYALLFEVLHKSLFRALSNTAWKVSKYGVISGPYFSLFGPNNSVFGHFSRSETCKM